MIETGTQEPGGGTAEQPRTHRTDGTKFFTPYQLADRWGWHVESVRRAIRQRRIESVIIYRRLVLIAEIERIDAEGRIGRVR